MGLTPFASPSAAGIECTLLEVQKLVYFLQREIQKLGLPDALKLDFQANRYGPYADPLRHLLNDLDGSYLQANVRVGDAKPTDVIAFNDRKREHVAAYLKSEAGLYREALERTSSLIDGFESPLGMELLATVDWLLNREEIPPNVDSVKEALARWPGGEGSGERKLRLFTDRMVDLAIKRLERGS